MGVSVQQWRATIGLWSGGRPGKCVTLQNCIAQTSNRNGYRLIRFLVLVSLLVIGCVELNPGPDKETASPSQNVGALPKFSRQPGTGGLQGEMNEIKMAAFLYARALNKTEEFRLASNVDGAGAFDDLVFRYRLREPNVWRTCFIKLKHKKDGGAIQLSSLKTFCGDFSLLKYFSSYCQIKAEAFIHNNLKQCGNFPDFEFIIYTNGSMESKSPVKGGDADPVSILSSGSNCGQYITFEETFDTDIFIFFEELSRYHDFITEMDSLLNGGTFVNKEINEKIKSFQSCITSKAILGKLNSLISMLSKDNVRRLKEELDKCDFSLFKEFLSKFKIFHSQTNQKSLKKLIEKELRDACKTSVTGAKFIYTKFEEGFCKWWEKSGSVVWLSKNSELWQAVEKYFAAEITDISEAEFQEVLGCGTHYSEQHIQRLSDVIKQNTFLNIITNSNIRTLHKLKTHQALSFLGYTNSLFISLKSLMIRSKEGRILWPCKWSDAMVIDCDCDGNVADMLLDIVLEPVDCEQGSDNSDGNMVETFVDIVQKYKKKVILISRRQHKNLASHLRGKLGNIFTDYEDNCNLSDFDEKSQKQILQRTVNFQGTNVALQMLVGTDPPEIIKRHIECDVIAVLLYSEEKLCVGRKLSEPSKIYVQRTLQHRVYLKNDILKLTDSAIAFAVSGVQADQLKKYLPAGEKICEFVYDESERSHSFRTDADFSKLGLSAERGTMKSHHQIGQKIKPKEVRYIILSKTQPESDFSELKALCTNVHWIHVEDGTLLWRESNCDIDIIRRYIDDTKCKKYDIKTVMEHDRTMLLVAEPGMGKSTFLSHMEHEIKEWNSSVWVLRINMHEHTSALEKIEFENECIDKCKDFLWNAAHSREKGALSLERKIFLQALEQREKLVIILDGFDEICPDDSPIVTKLLRTIIDKTSSNVWVSSRFPYRQHLEDILIKLAYTLQPFTTENQMQFLEQYWSGAIKLSKQENLRLFAKNVLSFCSQNFSDKDGEFTGIPLQIMMLGEAFVKEAEEYCSSGEVNLPEKINLLALFRKFTEKKFNIYFNIIRNADNNTALHLTAKSGNVDIIKLLLDKGMTVNLTGSHEFTPLHVSAECGNLEATKTLVEAGAGLNNSNEYGNTPLMVAALYDKLELVRYLTQIGADINIRNSNNSTALHLVAKSGNVDIIKLLLDKGMTVNLTGSEENTPLHVSAEWGNLEATKTLVEAGAGLNNSNEYGNTPLMVAALNNKLELVRYLTQIGADINIRDADNDTALHFAAQSGNVDIIKLLLDKGMTVNLTGSHEYTPLHVSAKCGNVEATKTLVESGAGLNNTNKYGDTPLMVAANYGKLELVMYLTQIGADINIRKAKKDTALHFAARWGYVDIIKLPLHKRMTVNLTDSYIFTQLHDSAKCGNLEATKTLVEKGAGLNNTNEYGNTPLMVAALNDKLELVRYLTQIGADINIRNNNNTTALHFAAQSGNVCIIKLLLDKGMTVNLTDSYKYTPLHVSAECGNLEATKTLVEKGAGLNNTTIDGNTPLMLAAYYGKIKLVRYLTQIGTDINIRNADNTTALHLAAKSGNVYIIKLLLDKGMTVNLTGSHEITPLHDSAACGNLEATKTLVEKGAGLNNTNKYGNTPLMVAALNDKLELVRYLTQIGADINIRNSNNHTALHLAAKSGSVDIIKLLLDKGMTVNLTDSDENTPLHVSAQCGNLEATKTLVEAGAGLNNSNEYGNTPLMVAALNDKLELVRYLTQIGADINIRDAGNATALHFAAQTGNVDTIKLLLDKGMTVNLTDSHKSTPLHVSVGYGNLEATKTLVEAGAGLNKTNIDGDTPLILAKRSGKSEFVDYLKGKGARSQQCVCL